MFVMSFNHTGAPVLLRGLFIFLAACACFAGDAEVGGSGGVLLYGDDGDITFWSGKASYGGGAFENGLRFLSVNSGMPWLETAVSGVGYSAAMDFGAVRPKAAAGLMSSGSADILYGSAKIRNDGADGFYAGSSLGFDVRGVEITPSFLFARAWFGDGDFYWFYGKPDIPVFIHAGLSAEYEKAHRVGVMYEWLGLNALNNGGVALFESGSYSAGINYRYSLPARQRPWGFYAAAGLHYAEFSVDGALTAANQQYALFPYAYYNLSGKADALAGWAMASLDIRGRRLEHRLKAGAGNIFSGSVGADAHYQYRKFYGDEEVSEEVLTLGLAETGAAFLAYALDSRGLKIRGNVRVRAGFQKIFIYHWGMDKLSSANWVIVEDGGGGGEGGDPAGEPPVDYAHLIKKILLTGLSGSLSVTF